MLRMRSMRLIACGLIFSIISADAEDSAELSPHDRLMEKMLSSKIEAFDIQNASLGELVDYLQTITKAADPARVGIIFAYEPRQTDGWKPQFSLTLKNTTLKKILDQLDDNDVGYRVENYDITLWMIGDEEFSRREFKVPTGFFGRNYPYQKDKIDVGDEFQAKGVRSPAGSSAEYIPAKGTVVVAGTARYVEEVDEVLSQFRIKGAKK